MLPFITDQNLIQFGPYKGQKMANVPAWYLLKIYDEPWLLANMKKYIDDNRDALEAEKKRANQQMRR
jgi:hypothetical protein